MAAGRAPEPGLAGSSWPDGGAPSKGLEAAVRDGAARLALPVGRREIEALVGYVELLARWNETYNLTSVRSRSQMVTRHLLDCLAVAPHLEGRRLLDLGTGAGLPGLVLAICGPERDWVLLDSNGKRTRFCRHAVAELGLANVDVARFRADAYRPPQPFDEVVCRGFGRLGAIWAAARHLLGPGGRVLAMKGRYPREELEELGSIGENATVVGLDVPGLDAERHLVVLTASRRDAP